MASHSPSKKQIRFVINPISGGKNKQHLPKLIDNCIDHTTIDPEIVFSSSPHQFRTLAQEAIEKGLDALVAVGGDGTINNLGSYLVNTQIALGIIPMGSGNGLARSLNIPLSLSASLNLINSFKVRKIDVGQVNGTYFFNIAGLGFDALIANLFKSSHKRGFLEYAKLVLNEFRRYKPSHYSLLIDGIPYETDAFLISICNGNQFGNNAFIAPAADLNDGVLNAIIIRKCDIFDAPKLVWQLFRGTIEKNELVQSIRLNQLELLKSSSNQLHVDGEATSMTQPLVFSLIPSGLNVIC